MTNNLKSKAVKIQGKEYVLVADRIVFFNENFPNGSITTEIITKPEDDKIIIKALVIPNSEKPERKFTGFSQATVGQGFINKTSALENAETSAVGRALALMGIGVIESIASADEVNKSKNASYSKPAVNPTPAPVKPQQDALKTEIVKLCTEIGLATLTTFNTKEDYEKFVQEKTGFLLQPDKYEMIIKSLNRIKSANEFKKDLAEPVKA